MSQPLPYGTDDLDAKVVYHPDPPKRIRCFVNGCRKFLVPAKEFCPIHGIRCHTSPTYIYEDPSRNIIVDADVFAKRIIGHPFKHDTDKIGNENSEDALSWNVFRSLQNAGCLGTVARDVFGLPSAEEPVLYLWGIQITRNTFVPWDLLIAARERFESDLPVKRPPTEPDIALHLPGVYLALIEAKFTSPNSSYEHGPRKDKQSLTFDELLKIYTDPSLKILDVNKAWKQERIFYQLWRNMIFAEWMSQKDGTQTKAFHFNLVREGYDEESAAEFHGLVNDGYKGRFHRVTWEEIYYWAKQQGRMIGCVSTWIRRRRSWGRRFEFQVSNSQRRFEC